MKKKIVFKKIVLYAIQIPSILTKKRAIENFSWGSRTVHFVSFENECILSIYDDRGCDIVFTTKEKMREFYNKLKPYFLEYDAEEMSRRFND